MPRALLPLLAITFVDVLGFTILIPILPFYAERYGASPTTVGAISSTVALCALVSSPLWGRLSDRIGRKGVLLAAQAAGFLGFSLLAAGDALWTIFAARAIEGLGGGGLGVTQAYVTDVTRPEQRARAFGLLGATYGVGFLIGPAAAAVLVRFGYRVPFTVAAALALLTVVLTAFMLPESKGRVETAPSLAAVRTSLRSPVLGRLLLTQFAFALGFTAWVGALALFVERVLGFGPSDTASIFIVSSIVAIGVQTALIGRLVDRFGEGRIALAGIACAILAYAGVGFVAVRPALYPFVALWSLSGGLIRPALGTLISDAAPADQRGTILGISDSLNNTAFLIGPLLSTTVLRFQPRLTGLVPEAFSLAAFAIGYAVFIRPRPDVIAQAEAA